MFITNYNIPWSLAALLLRNTCHFQDGCLNWKLHSSLIFFGERISSLQHTMPPKVLQHSFDKYFSLQIKISLEVLQHYFWETHAFFKMPFSIGNYIHLWSFFEREFLYYNTQYSLKCCSIIFGSFENYMPFSKCLLQLGHSLLFDKKVQFLFGKCI